MDLSVLKASTRDLHDAVEHAVDIMAATRSRNDYTRLLARFYGFHAAFEPRLEAVPGLAALPLDLPLRRKVPLLELDLRVLGFANADLTELPRCAQFPALTDPARALGAMYVLEGATLGGAVISRLLAERLQLTRHDGGCYFASYGARVGAMWRSFCAVLVGMQAGEAVQHEITASARATFGALIHWFDPRYPHAQR